MNISVTTTADKMAVKDLDAGHTLTWVDQVSIGYDPNVRRITTCLIAFSDSTISVVSAPPESPPVPATPATPA